jgi:hypothetical protein
MKPLSLVTALSFICILTGASAFAAKQDDCPVASKSACGCEVKADAKVCGIDTDCCCTGEKAKGRAPEKKAAKSDCGTDRCSVDEKAGGRSERPAYGKLRR